ncbi:mycofactocin-coupled SDR family oxidoreductase [Streptomyces sp. NBC_01808]|uniref:mycofactocin-coupled SDR family oxidoreductase n=1 Tax=Streptomyces sp. NBC_01808 TaxID=2975947 RepID=UPI002DDC67D6|nr:mycofactocin-coupled SDR family oxidoreductase [Streptomyces sp. NBC_01808]WSA36281.1 mycofactocin-coupled SDR family oxidoreductase [Streptomyces sp. NBC_01808]
MGRTDGARDGKLDGKVAFITGAARGQGRAHAVRLAAEGADIIAADVGAAGVVGDAVGSVPYALGTTEDLAETARLVEAEGRRAVHGTADVRDLDALARVVDRGVGELGRLDIVVANAGISSPAPTLEMSEQVWQEMIDVNLTGVWKTLKVSVPHVVRGGRGGAVVLTSSGATDGVWENLAHYSAAKAGLVPLMRVLAKELAGQGIRVNTLHTGTVVTPMILNDATYRAFRPDLAEPTRADFDEAVRAASKLPYGPLEPDDIARAVLYLVSDDGRGVTGAKHVVDAGVSL